MNIDISRRLPDGRLIATLTDEEELEEWFTHHAPNEEQIVAYAEIRDTAKMLAKLIIKHAPSCADRSAAIRKLRECVMTANASIATGGV